MDAKKTGAFIAALRRERGLTQKELAERLAVSDKAVSRWETGKGFPDTGLLPPLAEALGVSVGELLAGGRAEAGREREQTEAVLLEAMAYGRHALQRGVGLLALPVGVALLLSPLFLASRGDGLWVAGLTVLAADGLLFWLERMEPARGRRWARRGAALALAGALALALLPGAAVLVFADGPDRRLPAYFNWFDPALVGYANFAPPLAGVLTVALLAASVAGLVRKGGLPGKGNDRVFQGTVLALALALLPRALFGADFMTAVGYGAAGCLALSLALQAVANRHT